MSSVLLQDTQHTQTIKTNRQIWIFIDFSWAGLGYIKPVIPLLMLFKSCIHDDQN